MNLFYRSLSISAVVIGLGFLHACTNNNAGAVAHASKAIIQETSPPPKGIISSPTIPLMIEKPEEKAMYFVTHFWDELNFVDTTILSSPQALEVSFANFIGVARSLPVSQVSTALTTPLSKASGPLIKAFLSLYEKYLYAPDSPMQDEEYYIPVLQWVKNSERVEYAEKVRLSERLELCLRNRLGYAATDFSFELPDGSTSRLYHQKAPYTVLIFYTPGCDSCRETIAQLKSHSLSSTWAANRKVVFLFIDAQSEQSAWLETQDKLPEWSTSGLDASGDIISSSLYDLKVSPTLYLLDHDKRVLFKEKPLDSILSYLATRLE